jgi:hypothetical protein
LDRLAEGAHLAEKPPVLGGAAREQEQLVGVDRLLDWRWARATPSS